MFGYVVAGVVGAFFAGAVRRAVWHRGWHRRQGFRRYAMHSIFDRLEATPAQEKVIETAMGEVREAMRKGREAAMGAREEVAKVLEQPTVGEEDVNRLFSRFDAPVDEVRAALGRAFRNIHEALDEKQRKLLSELVGRGFSPRHFGPRMHGRHGCGHRRACAAAC